MQGHKVQRNVLSTQGVSVRCNVVRVYIVRVYIVRVSVGCARMKDYFHIKGRAVNLVLLKRPGGTRKWPTCIYLGRF